MALAFPPRSAEARRRLRGCLDFLAYVSRRFLGNRSLERAAALTYTTLFAVVPLMTVAFAMLSMVEAFSGVGDQIQAFVFTHFVPSAGEVVQERLREFSDQARQLTGAGVVVLVVTAYAMLLNVERAFNEIWGVRRGRRGVARFLLYWGILTLSPLLLGLGFAVSSYLFSLPLLEGDEGTGVRRTLLVVLPFVSSAAAFTVLYAAVPNTRVRVRDAFIGGLVSMLAYESAKYAFGFVVRQTSVEVIYGTFAAIPLFLGWLYLTWVVVLAGAELVHALGVRRYRVVRGGGAMLLVALEFLERIHARHRIGGGLPDRDAQPVLQRLGPDALPSMLEALESARIVSRDREGAWLPGRDFGHLSVVEVQRALPGELASEDVIPPDADDWRGTLRGRLQRLREVRQATLGLTLAELFADGRSVDRPPRAAGTAEASQRDGDPAGEATAVTSLDHKESRSA